jgi:hypothetical protein
MTNSAAALEGGSGALIASNVPPLACPIRALGEQSRRGHPGRKAQALCHRPATASTSCLAGHRSPSSISRSFSYLRGQKSVAGLRRPLDIYVVIRYIWVRGCGAHCLCTEPLREGVGSLTARRLRTGFLWGGQGSSRSRLNDCRNDMV